MLARTAENLYWLARYIERADFLARLLQGAAHMSAVRVDADRSSEWQSALLASGSRPDTLARPWPATASEVIHYLAFDPANLSSIVSCLETARQNARAVRTALTVDMWDAVNGTWLELRHFDPARMDDDRLRAFLDWVQARAGLFHGVYASTMLRTDGFRFTRLGQFLERADNSARLLDARLRVDGDDIGAQVDDHPSLAILRVVGARRAYRVLFKGRVAPAQVADLLLLRPEFPRSLVFCFEQITQQLDQIAGQDPHRSAEAKRLAHSLYAQLRFGRIDHILAHGLHRYLDELIGRTGQVGREIASGHGF